MQVNFIDLIIKTFLNDNILLTRPQLVKFSEIARTTLYDRLVKRIIDNSIVKFNVRNGVGRPEVYFILRKPALALIS